MRTKKNNKFDAVSNPTASVENLEITSISTFKTFIGQGKVQFMKTGRGEFAYLEILEKYIERVQKQRRHFIQRRESVSIEYLAEIDDVLKEARDDLNQAIQYKYYPIQLFNNWEGVDDEFKEFVIRYAMKHYGHDSAAMGANNIWSSYTQEYEKKAVSHQSNMISFIGILLRAVDYERASIRKAAAGLLSFEDLCRVLYPVVNKFGNEDWDKILDRSAWSKESKNSLNSVKPEDSLFIEKVNKRKRD